MTSTDTLRSAQLSDLVPLLRDQQTRRQDVVLPAKNVWFQGGQLRIAGADPVMDDDGVTDVNGVYRPTAVFDDGLSEKLGMPRAFLRRLRDEGRTHLLDQNLNELLHGWADDGVDGMDKRFMIRSFRASGEHESIARALLSPSFRPIENIDVLMAVLDGMKRAGLGPQNIKQCDLTERRMYVTVTAEEIKALAPELLGNYRSPFSGNRGADNPTVFAGLVISNSETGDGAFSITPRLTVQVCSNGMTITKDAFRKTHLGAKLDDGVIKYSDETHADNLRLIASQAKDAVTTFLNVEYMQRVINELTEKSAEKIPATEAQKRIEVVSTKLAYGKEAAAGILDHFLTAGDLTRGGVLHAVTSFAQTVEDADKAFAMESSATRVLDLV